MKALTPDQLGLLYKKVEEAVKQQFAHLPEDIRLKKRALDREETRIKRFVDFIASAKATASIATALKKSESKAATLKVELQSLEKSKGELFEPPPREWLIHRIADIQQVLEEKTTKSALLLRKLTGKIALTPVRPDIGKPYYHAKSRLKSFAVLKAPSQKGSNCVAMVEAAGIEPACERMSRPGLRV